MKKDMIFFTSEGAGLTSTSANHVANLAKEMIRNIEIGLGELQFYSTSVALIGGGVANSLDTGAVVEDVESVPDRLHNIAEAKSLIAWLREAIKARERLLNEVRDMSLSKWCEQEGEKIPEQPRLGESLTEDDYWASRPMAERCHYYELETLAATLGKAIHPGGALADAREQLQQRLKKPNQVVGDGRDTLIYTYTSSVDAKIVEDVYFRLQKQYRDAQARLNILKHECMQAVEQSATTVKSEYTRAMKDWSAQHKLLEARHAEYTQKRMAELGAMRIIIPESLQSIYRKVNSLGKSTD